MLLAWDAAALELELAGPEPFMLLAAAGIAAVICAAASADPESLELNLLKPGCRLQERDDPASAAAAVLLGLSNAWLPDAMGLLVLEQLWLPALETGSCSCPGFSMPAAVTAAFTAAVLTDDDAVLDHCSPIPASSTCGCASGTPRAHSRYRHKCKRTNGMARISFTVGRCVTSLDSSLPTSSCKSLLQEAGSGSYWPMAIL
jgi:hypothetical protein